MPPRAHPPGLPPGSAWRAPGGSARVGTTVRLCGLGRVKPALLDVVLDSSRDEAVERLVPGGPPPDAGRRDVGRRDQAEDYPVRVDAGRAESFRSRRVEAGP